jgi:predicted metalloprotease with PDZ domain
MPHEFVHSWNGKHRRPAGMVTRDFQKPQRTELLWVYEGLTQYLMVVLTARSGLWSAEETRDFLAMIAQRMDDQRGRTWRPLEDTAAAAHLLYPAPNAWSSWRRSVDFYDEGVLLWLEVDTLIREQSGGKKSLDDFCRRFYGGASGPPSVRAYTFDDLCAALNEVSPYDWKAHLTRRVAGVSDRAPFEGLTQGGWRLTSADKPSALQKSYDALSKQTDLGPSLGLVLGTDGVVADVVRGKPADKAGVAPGMKLVAVNGRRFSTERLTDAVEATAKGDKLELLAENGEFFRTYALDYRGGARYARLEKIVKDGPDTLTAILRPQAREEGKPDR